MRTSRGMGAIRPELKKPKVIRRKDGDKVDLYAEGGDVKQDGAQVNVMGGGGGNKRAVGGGGRVEARVPVGKNADIQAYVDVWGAKAKDMPLAGGVSGGGIRFNKRFAEGGETRSRPQNPSLWSKVKAEAKAKFDVYPSAYANAWAAKEYKSRGGSWAGADNRVKRG